MRCSSARAALFGVRRDASAPSTLRTFWYAHAQVQRDQVHCFVARFRATLHGEIRASCSQIDSRRTYVFTNQSQRSMHPIHTACVACPYAKRFTDSTRSISSWIGFARTHMMRQSSGSASCVVSSERENDSSSSNTSAETRSTWAKSSMWYPARPGDRGTSLNQPILSAMRCRTWQPGQVMITIPWQYACRLKRLRIRVSQRAHVKAMAIFREPTCSAKRTRCSVTTSSTTSGGSFRAAGGRAPAVPVSGREALFGSSARAYKSPAEEQCFLHCTRALGR
jgi:hypothetical protein